MLCVDVTQGTFMANQEVKFIYFETLVAILPKSA
jgi:hypothetical protein